MARMRGVESFNELWGRRTTIELDGENIELLSLPDLVKAKKTQRDKDWPMIRRLLEVHYFQNRHAPSPEQIQFWIRELRTPELLREVLTANPEVAKQMSAERSALSSVIEESNDALEAEENIERQRDSEYWQPLKRQLEDLRLRRNKASQ